MNLDITKYINKGLIKIRAIPNAKETKLVEDNGLRLYLHAPPEKDKANLEVIKFFKKEFGLKVKIEVGLRNRNKVLRIL